LSIDLLSNTIYWSMSFTLFDYLHKKYNVEEELYYYKKIYYIFGATTFNAILASFIIYPLDTFKRHLQVNNGFGYNSEYNSFSNAIREFTRSSILDKYRGFSFHLLKTIPYSFIHYTIYLSIPIYFDINN
jgi:hypothetical protein